MSLFTEYRRPIRADAANPPDQAAGAPTLNRPPNASHVGQVCIIAGIAYMAGIVVLHLGLLTRGAWGGDEYRTIGIYADNGVGFLWFRFWSWSPRPLYAWAVVTLHQPLIVPALAVIWL